jgi:hypothetical protein
MTNWNEPDEEEDDLDEIKPGDPDYDLAEGQPWSWEPKREPIIPPLVTIIVTLLVIAALVVPSIIIVLHYD